jgi:hypothetical protein
MGIVSLETEKGSFAQQCERKKYFAQEDKKV